MIGCLTAKLRKGVNLKWTDSCNTAQGASSKNHIQQGVKQKLNIIYLVCLTDSDRTPKAYTSSYSNYSRTTFLSFFLFLFASEDRLQHYTLHVK